MRTPPVVAAAAPSLRVLRVAGALLSLVAAAASAASALQTAVVPVAASRAGTLMGVVRDSAGNEIVSAEVFVGGGDVVAPRRVLSDAHGAFVVRDAPVGNVTLRVRRLGFRPSIVATVVTGGLDDAVDVVLAALPQRLEAVQVRARAREYGGFLAAFNRRRELGQTGHFITRAQIDSLRPHRTTDVLRRVAGLTFTREANGDMVVRGRDQRCTPLVWLDGMPVTSAYFDPDNVSPTTIAGIEIYNGLAAVPAELMGPRELGSCGVIAIWTRIDEPRRRLRGDVKTTATRLAALVDSLQLFTAEQVDAPAQLDPLVAFAPEYPGDLRPARLQGLVVAEFVVDTTGRVENATLDVVSSTHVLFTEAVDSALSSARFQPATLNGRRVRQVVHLPVRFTPPSSSAEPSPSSSQPQPSSSSPPQTDHPAVAPAAGTQGTAASSGAVAARGAASRPPA